MKISSKIKDYTYELSADIFRAKKKIYGRKGKNSNFFYLIDKNVYNIYRDKITGFISDDYFYVVPAEESSKTLPYIIRIYRNLFKAGITRSDFVVTFGGGILQDVSGFIASTIYRSVRWIFFPTTLLSQADSCIGSKTSLNFDQGKNQLGTFYPPDYIFIDTKFNDTLPDNYFNSGLGEIIKVHLMAGDKEFSTLKDFVSLKDIRKTDVLSRLINKSLEIKKSFFEGDEFDRGRRNLLNYGHTFGHALESASNFSISHGEAVMMGIGFANIVSLKRNIMTRKCYEEIEKVLVSFYPLFNLSSIPVEEIVKFMRKDKKRRGTNLSMILLEKVGNLKKYDDILEEEVFKSYIEFQKKFILKEND